MRFLVALAALLALQVHAATVSLGWDAAPDPATSGYVVERCQGAGCSAFVDIASVSVLTYTDSALADGTSYTWRVRAVGPVPPGIACTANCESNVVSATTSAAPPPPAQFTIGETNVLAINDCCNANGLFAQNATLSQPGQLVSLTFDVLQAAGSLRLGVFRDNAGKPGGLVAQTASFTPVLGWNRAAVITPVVLQPGTYWLAYLPSDDNLHFANSNTAGDGDCYYYSYTFGAMPATFSTTPIHIPGHWSFYATLNAAPPPPLAPTGLAVTIN